MSRPQEFPWAHEVLDDLRDNRCTRSGDRRRLPFSVVQEIVRESLDRAGQFPEGKAVEDLGDGAVIKVLGEHRFEVYERYETGIMKFSPIECRRYFFLRRAVGRYLRHYTDHFRVSGIEIERWA